jgi:hypothetical protein
MLYAAGPPLLDGQKRDVIAECLISAAPERQKRTTWQECRAEETGTLK